VDFALNEIQQELKTQARAWLAEKYPLDRDWDAPQDDRWSELAELGWLDVAEAELGFVEEALLCEEMGYALYPGPFVMTVGVAYSWLGPEERAKHEKWSVEIHGLVPQLGSVDWVAVHGEAFRAQGEEHPSVDPTRPLGKLERSGEGRALPGGPPKTRARAALACEAVGIAQRALELGVEHAKTRTQFGKPIGTYQAVSHQLADTYTDVELARSLAYWAAWCVAEDDVQAEIASAAAKAFATEAAVRACERSIQVHGGIGFTWEHPLHRFYKRALWLNGFPQSPAQLRAEVAEALLGVAVTA
jgi:alkylation response protein AidB-like acyl-CoA dehydrogenase